MRQATRSLEVATRGKGLTEITGEVRRWLAGQDIATGVLTVFCRHTSASVIIQENADPDVRTDLEAYLEAAAPEDPGRYVHGLEGPDDMPAHIRTMLTDVSLSIPIVDGRLALGTWQGIYVFEHRARPHRPEIVLHLMGA